MTVEIHPTAIVAKGAELAEGVSIGPYSIIGEHVKIGPRTQVLAHVVIENRTTVGADCTVRNFANLGGPPHHTGYKGRTGIFEIMVIPFAFTIIGIWNETRSAFRYFRVNAFHRFGKLSGRKTTKHLEVEGL